MKEGLSIYGYCRNNPLIFKDPTGLETKNIVEQFKTNVAENKGDMLAGLYKTILNNKENSFSIDKKTLESALKDFKVEKNDQLTNFLENFKSLNYSYDGKKGQLDLKLDKEIKLDLTEKISLNLKPETKYSIDFKSDDKWTLTAQEKSQPTFKGLGPLNNVLEKFDVGKDKQGFYFQTGAIKLHPSDLGKDEKKK